APRCAVPSPLGTGGEIAGSSQRREPAWVKAVKLDGDTRLPARLLVLPVGPLEAPSRCALVLGWEDPGYTLPSEDLNVLGGLARQLELALSSQDRAAAVDVLEAEMAQARTHL